MKGLPGRCLAVLLLVTAVSGCKWNWLERVNVSSAGEQGSSESESASISGEGRYVAFQSEADNLVPDDFNDSQDVFVRDMLSGTTTRISVSSTGLEGNDNSGEPSISDDGRYVAFSSGASNLVPGDAPYSKDIFLHDRDNGTTTRVSVYGPENLGNGNSERPEISEDGRYIAYQSSANALVAGDTNGVLDVFVYDRESDTNTRVSVDSDGNQAMHGGSGYPAISGNGRYITFASSAINLVVGDTNGDQDIFVHDRDLGITSRVSVDSAGNEANHNSTVPAISADGRYVAYASLASNLIEGDANRRTDIFVYDRDAGSTRRVSVDSEGNEANWDSREPDISPDGRLVAFATQSSNLVADDYNGGDDVFIHDRLTAHTRRVSLQADGSQVNYESNAPSISRDGRYIAFDTSATNLIANDANGSTRDVVVRSLPNITVTSVSPLFVSSIATTVVTVKGANFVPGVIPYLGNAELGNLVVEDENTITMDVTPKPDTPDGPQDLVVGLPGTGPGPYAGAIGSCTNCIVFSKNPPGC